MSKMTSDELFKEIELFSLLGIKKEDVILTPGKKEGEYDARMKGEPIENKLELYKFCQIKLEEYKDKLLKLPRTAEYIKLNEDNNLATNLSKKISEEIKGLMPKKILDKVTGLNKSLQEDRSSSDTLFSLLSTIKDLKTDIIKQVKLIPSLKQFIHFTLLQGIPGLAILTLYMQRSLLSKLRAKDNEDIKVQVLDKILDLGSLNNTFAQKVVNARKTPNEISKILRDLGDPPNTQQIFFETDENDEFGPKNPKQRKSNVILKGKEAVNRIIKVLSNQTLTLKQSAEIFLRIKLAATMHWRGIGEKGHQVLNTQIRNFNGNLSKIANEIKIINTELEKIIKRGDSAESNEYNDKLQKLAKKIAEYDVLKQDYKDSQGITIRIGKQKDRSLASLLDKKGKKAYAMLNTTILMHDKLLNPHRKLLASVKNDKDATAKMLGKGKLSKQQINKAQVKAKEAHPPNVPSAKGSTPQAQKIPLAIQPKRPAPAIPTTPSIIHTAALKTLAVPSRPPRPSVVPTFLRQASLGASSALGTSKPAAGTTATSADNIGLGHKRQRSASLPQLSSAASGIPNATDVSNVSGSSAAQQSEDLAKRMQGVISAPKIESPELPQSSSAVVNAHVTPSADTHTASIHRGFEVITKTPTEIHKILSQFVTTKSSEKDNEVMQAIEVSPLLTSGNGNAVAVVISKKIPATEINDKHIEALYKVAMEAYRSDPTQQFTIKGLQPDKAMALYNLMKTIPDLVQKTKRDENSPPPIKISFSELVMKNALIVQTKTQDNKLIKTIEDMVKINKQFQTEPTAPSHNTPKTAT